MSWRSLGSMLPDRLTDARLELHYAAQLVSAPGAVLLPAAPDDSHMNLVWDASLEVLAGRRVGERSFRAALVFESLELAVLEGTLERGSFALAGSTMQQALTWLDGSLGKTGRPLSFASYDMPAHPLANGAAFAEAGSDARAELAAWFANATAVIRGAVRGDPNASPVRCWPHHFDVASLSTIDGGMDPEHARSVGVGFSPGDAAYPQPYFYVSPFPYPEVGALPSLPEPTHWHTEGWTGAVLLGQAVVAQSPSRQERLVRDALASAIQASRAVLGA